MSHVVRLRPASQQRLSEEVAAEISDAILRGDLAPGDHLVEADLVKSLHVSKSPIREALRQLSAQGLVSIEPRRGAFVRSLTAKDVRDIGIFRSTLEALAVTLSVEHWDPAWVDQLGSAIETMRRARGNRQLDELHLQFHQILVSRCDNTLLLNALASVGAQVRSFIAIVDRLYPTGEEVAADHEALIAAVLTRDPNQIRLEVEEHIVSSFRRLEGTWQARGAHADANAAEVARPAQGASSD